MVIAPFFQNHLAFGLDIFGGERQAGHPVGFHGHYGSQLLARDHLIIPGLIPRREGVLIAAIAPHQRAKIALWRLLRALEHQVFKEMGQARIALHFISRAHLVP